MSEQSTKKVTADNYVRAESDYQFKTYDEVYPDCFGEFHHNQEPYDIDNQITVRGNRDTLYSFGVFDLSYPLAITLPEPEGRFQSLMMVSQDHSIPAAIYGPAKTIITPERIGTRYVFIVIRTFADPNDEDDMKAAFKLQKAIKVEQENIGTLDLPNWDKTGIKTIRDHLAEVGSTLPDMSTFFGEKDELDPIHHLLGTAVGWGGNPKEAALYLNVYPEKNDGNTPYTLTVKDVPVDGFWSVTVYDAEGFMVKNEYNAYSYNDITADKEDDGTIIIHFGGDSGETNYLPIMNGWNYIVRLYQPKEELLNKSWQFPAPVPVTKS